MVARVKSTISRFWHISICVTGLKSNWRGVPQERTICALSGVPTGTLGCGIFGIVKRILLSSSSFPDKIFVRSVILAEISFIEAITCLGSCFALSNALISSLALFCCARRPSTSPRIFLRPSSIFTRASRSNLELRFCKAMRTISMFSRIKRISSILLLLSFNNPSRLPFGCGSGLP